MGEPATSCKKYSYPLLPRSVLGAGLFSPLTLLITDSVVGYTCIYIILSTGSKKTI